MLDNLRPTDVLYRDGTIRARRMLLALDAAGVGWEDRTLEDWLRFAQAFACQVDYINDQNTAQGTWEGFLCQHPAWPDPANNQSEEAQAEWRLLMADFARGTLAETTPLEVRRALAQPHRVLFLAFLRLMEQFRAPFNTLLQRHLDHHMGTVLKFSPRQALGDTVRVQAVLEEDSEPQKLPAGTLLDAGEDEAGTPLHYATLHDTYVYPTQVGRVMNLYLTKRIETLAWVHLDGRSDIDRGFMRLLEFAVGAKGIGTPLNPVPGGTEPPTTEDIMELHRRLQDKQNLTAQEETNDADWQYLWQELFLDFRALDNLIQIQHRYTDPNLKNFPNEWQLAFQYLTEAYLRKAVVDRQQTLRQLYESASTQSTGYLNMLAYAFGEPNPGDTLPEYRGTAVTPELLATDLASGNNAVKNFAEKYLSDEWSMDAPAFGTIHTLLTQDSRTEAEWQKAMELVETAMRKKRRIAGLPPQREVIGDLHACTNPSEELATRNPDASHQAWPTLGSPEAPLAQMGWRIQSPLLALSAGNREITLSLSLDHSSLTHEVAWLLDFITREDEPPFTATVAVNEEVYPPESLKVAYKSELLGEPEGYWPITAHEGMLEYQSSAALESSAQGLVWVDATGALRSLGKSTGSNQFVEIYIGQMSPTELAAANLSIPAGHMAGFLPERVLSNALHLILGFSVDAPSLFPEAESEEPDPVLEIRLNPEYAPDSDELPFEWRGLIPTLRNVQMRQMQLAVTVDKLPVTLASNDFADLDTEKPYEPFDNPCLVGNTFYFTHPEVAAKPLDELTLDLGWMQVPNSFADYYQGYVQLAGEPLVSTPDTVTARMGFRDGNVSLTAGENLPLFHTQGPLRIPLRDVLRKEYPKHRYQYREVPAEEAVQDHQRYFSLEYTGHSFGQNHFEVTNIRFFQQLASADTNTPLVKPKEPFVPRTKHLHLGYRSSLTLSTRQPQAESSLRLSHISPFGLRPLTAGDSAPLLPEYNYEGELYLCLQQAQAGQALSLWFQLADGSANPEVSAPTLRWQYPSPEGWVNLPDRQLLRDDTRGLTQTGTMVLQLPSVLHPTPELPNEGYWLRVVAPRYATGIPSTIAIMANGLDARLVPGQHQESHFERPLLANTITELVDAPVEIAELRQPFSSSHGIPTEKPRQLYTRASERIRHKQRVLTSWDYEHMILAEFPEVYKVRCLSADHTRLDDPGAVKVVVIPDLRAKTPFDPFQPKLPESRLEAIHQYVSRYTPLSAWVKVVNPKYVQIKTRFAVRLHPGLSPEVCVENLQRAVKQYLAPWAYEEGHEITFGGELYANSLVGFVESLPYVDYLARVRLFRSDNGKTYEAVQDVDGQYRVEVQDPDSIMVSAPSHDIDLIGDAGYELSSFEGINHDKVELDFQVGNE